MENAQIRAGIAEYKAETANIRYFLREQRTIFEWQDWLWRRAPKLKAVTSKIGPSTMVLGQGWRDISCRYSDLLTYLCMLGDVERERGNGLVKYRWVGE